MRILFKNIDNSLTLGKTTTFSNDLGWEESFKEAERDILESIINPVENYETIRYINEPYTESTGLVSDIWYFFYFIDGSNTYAKGLDYSLAGITPKENALLLKQTTKSFFRLEFYTTPSRETQKLVFAKNLPIPLGQKVFDQNLLDNIFVPVFNGNNYRNTENMYLFWFGDDTIFSGTSFYMTARFFNADDGTITQFLNKDLNVDNSGLTDGQRLGSYATPIKFYEIASNYNVVPEEDLYYCVSFRRTDHTYKITRCGDFCQFSDGTATIVI
jgi:hypothetical protein